MKRIPRKGCPFCGSLGSDVKRQQHYGRRVWIECRLCQGRGPVRLTMPDACISWNRRPAVVLTEQVGNVIRFRRVADKKKPGDPRAS